MGQPHLGWGSQASRSEALRLEALETHRRVLMNSIQLIHALFMSHTLKSLPNRIDGSGDERTSGRRHTGSLPYRSLAAQSGMASIYRAVDLQNGMSVAIKVPHFEVESDSLLFDR